MGADRAEQALLLRNEWRKHWVISLALGNGAALLAVCSAVLQKPIAASFLTPSAWAFFAGLIAAGTLPWVRIHINSQSRTGFLLERARLEAATQPTATQPPPPPCEAEAKAKKLCERFDHLSSALQVVAAATFLVGVASGLLHLQADSSIGSGDLSKDRYSLVNAGDGVTVRLDGQTGDLMSCTNMSCSSIVTVEKSIVVPKPGATLPVAPTSSTLVQLKGPRNPTE